MWRRVGNRSSIYPGPERSWRGVPRALVVDADGLVWSSGDDGLLRFYDPRIGAFGETSMRIPGEYWETQAYNAFPVVEQMFVREDGTFIGTTSDGSVFIGESDRRAKLFIFIPGGEVMPGVLNPTNPR